MIQPGSKLAHYEIVSALGKGGMGEVWRARDTKLGREVAIKTLPAEFAQDQDRLARFEREAKLLASLNHPNIAAIHGLEESDGTRFLVLELVEGDTLADRLTHGAIPVEEALQLALQIAEALEAAHEKGVIHRDLKPANIKVTPDGRVKVLDFGLAKAFIASDASASQSPTISVAATQQGMILGTAAYMSPEQARGHEVDARTDVWAFGCVLFEMLTGKAAFPGSDVTDILAAVVRAEPDWDALRSDLNPRILELLKRCLQKDFKRRKQSIGDVRVEVEEIEPGLMRQVEASGSGGPAPLRASALAGGAGVVLGGLLVFALMNGTTDAPGESVARFEIPLPPGLTNTEVFFEWPSAMLVISPDGERIAVVGGPSSSLHVRELSGLEYRELPNTAGARNPFFAPDGDRIAFFTRNTGELKVTSLAEGSQPQTIVAGISASDWVFGSWGDDGSIIFSSVDVGGLYLLPAGADEFQSLTTAVDAAHQHPKILPGSSAVVFTSEEHESTSVQVAKLTEVDTVPIRLFENASHPHYLASGHLLFVREGSLWAAPFDTDTFSVGPPVSIPLDVVFDVPAAYSPVPQLALSETGTLVYMRRSDSGTQTTRLVWIDRSGNVVDDLGPLPARTTKIQLSPDESKLAMEYRDGADVVVSIFDMTRRQIESELIRKGQPFPGFPVWADPDGESLILSQPGVGRSRMFLQGVVGGTGTTELFEIDESWQFPHSLSSDGRLLLFNGFNGNDPSQGSMDIGIYAMDEDSSDNNPRWIMVGPAREDAPAWAPDGESFAFVRHSTGQPEVWIQPYPEGVAVRVSPPNSNGPHWSTDGTELFFQSDWGNQMWTVPITSNTVINPGTPRMLFEGSFDQSGDAGLVYDVSRDGERFLMAQTDPQSEVVDELVIVLNWLQEINDRVSVP